MANERVDIDLALKRISDLEKVFKLLNDSSNKANDLVSKFGKMDTLMSQLAKTTQKYQIALSEASGGRGLGQTGSMLAKGNPSSFLTNSATTGQIRNFESTMEQVFARLTNRFAKGMNDVVRSVKNNEILELSKTRQVSPSTDLTTLNNQIQAQQARVAAEQLRMERLSGAARTSKGFTVEKELMALNALNAARTEILAKEKQSEQVEMRLLSIQEKMTKAIQEYRVAKLAGGNIDQTNARDVQANQLQRAALLVERQRQIVAREKLKSEGEYTEALKRQEARLARLLGLESQIRAANKDKVTQQTRDANVDRVLGDSGASLFKIQAALMVNYTLMNKLIGAFQFGTQFVVEYDRALTDLQAIVEITDVELEGLSNTFVDISKNTKFSAVQIAEAATTMGQAGFSAREIQDSIGAVALFATATGEKLSTAVELATSAITVFNLQASEMGNVANVLTGAINLSKLTVDKLSYGIQYAGNTAAEAGITLNELVSVLGAMSNAGIKSGSTLGTGLRQMIVELQTPSKKFREELKKVGLSVEDVNVKSRGLVPVLETLRDAGFNSASAFKAFELRAAAAYLAASRNVEVAADLETQLTLTNAAAEANARQMNSIANSAARASNALGSAFVDAAGPMKTGLTSVLNLFADLVGILSKIPGLLEIIGIAFTSIVGGVAVVQIGKLIGHLTGFTAAMGTATAGVGFFRAALTVLTGPIGIVSAIIAGVATAFTIYGANAHEAAKRMDELTAAVNKAQGDLDSTKDRITSVDTELARLNGRYAEFTDNSVAVQNEVLQMQTKFGQFSEALGSGAITTVEELIKALRELRGEMSKTAMEQAAFVVTKQAVAFNEGVTKLRDNLKGNTWNGGRQVYQKDQRGQVLQGVVNSYASAGSTIGQYQNFDLNSATPAELEDIAKVLRTTRGNLINQAALLNKNTLELNKQAEAGDNIAAWQSRANKSRADDIQSTIDQFMKLEQQVVTTKQLKREMTNQAVEGTQAAQNFRKELGDLDQKQSLAQKEFRTAKTKAAKAEAEQTVKRIQKLKEEKVTEAGTEFSKAVSSELGKAPEELSNPVNNFIAAAAESVNNSRQVIENMHGELADKTKEHFDAITELQKLGIEKVKRAIEQATDGIDRQISDIDSTISQATDTTRGGLRGRYSDVEISMMEDKRNQLQTDRVKTRVDAIQTALPEFDMMVQRQKELYEASVRSYNADTKSADKLRAMIATEKDYNSALNDRRSLMNELADLQTEYVARTGQEAEAHKTLGEQLSYAIERYREQFHLQNDLGLNLQKNVTAVLDNATSAFGTFVKEVGTGTKSIGAAFKDMARSIIESMLDIAAKQAASGLLGGLTSLFGSAIGAMTGGIDMSTHASAPIIGVSSTNLGPLARGSYIRAASGRAVTTRDSVPILAQPGEYLLRKSAVDMIGRDTLDSMNANGNRQISAGAAAIAPYAMGGGDAKVPVNVWVITPDQQPGLTEKDVVAIVSSDLSRGGSLKKLIKQVVV